MASANVDRKVLDNLSVRRGSEPQSHTSQHLPSIGSDRSRPSYHITITPNSVYSIARRPTADVIAAERERSHVLRTIPQLSKDQANAKIPVDASEGDEHGTPRPTPFTRFDLVPPPCYRARDSSKSMDFRNRARAWSFGDDRRTSTSSSLLKMSESRTNASQLSISSSSAKAAAQEKARAVASKIRKFSTSQLVSRSQVDDGGQSAHGSADSSSSALASLTVGTESMPTSSHSSEAPLSFSTSGRERGYRNANATTPASVQPSLPTLSPSSPCPSLTLSLTPSPADEERGEGEGNATRMNGRLSDYTMVSDSGPAHAFISGHSRRTLDGSLITPSDTPDLSGLATTLGSAETRSDLLESRTEAKKRGTSSSSSGAGPCQPILAPTAAINSAQQTGAFAASSSHEQLQHLKAAAPSPSPNTAPQHADATPTEHSLQASLNITTSTAGPLPHTTYPATSFEAHHQAKDFPHDKNTTMQDDTPSLPTSLPPSYSRSSKISFDLSGNAQCVQELRAASRVPSIPLVGMAPGEDNVPTVSPSTASFLDLRRGSAPTDTTARRRSAFRLGLSKFGGSSIDLNSSDRGADSSRRSSQLEIGSRRQSEVEGMEGARSFGTTAESSPQSRFSFSSVRRRQSQDIRRPSGLSLFSKMNRSRDQLNLSARDADVTGEETYQRIRRRSEAGSAARHFLRKALGRSERADTPTAMEATIPASYSSSVICSETIQQDQNENTPFSVDDAAHQAFASAFGAPQRSNAKSAQAFESINTSATAGPSAVRQAPRGREETSSTRPSSRASAATSFFSMAESTSQQGGLSRPTSSRFAGLEMSAFERSRSASRGDGQMSRSTSAFHRHAYPEEEQGPLGERRSPLLGNYKEISTGMSESENASSPQAQIEQQHRDASHLSGLMLQIDASSMTNSSEQYPYKAAQAQRRENRVEEQLSRAPPPSATLGIDEEQNALESRQRVSLDQETSGIHLTTQAGGRSNHDSSGNGDGNRNGGGRRGARSSRLSHLPRLNSMRVFSGGEAAGGTSMGGDDGDDGDDHRRGRNSTSGRSEDLSSETDTGDELHDDEVSETESDAETDASEGSAENTSAMPGWLSIPAAQQDSPADVDGSSQRSRPAEISLPPVPAFDESQSSHGIEINTGRNSWVGFDNSLTPAETPRISLLAKPTANGLRAATAYTTGASSSFQKITPTHSITQTPKATADTEASYFNIGPAPARNAGPSNPKMPPPSPSIITRARAPSSASRRSLRSPARELPPLPPITPLHFTGIDSPKSTTNRSLETQVVDSSRSSLPVPKANGSASPILSGPSSLQQLARPKTGEGDLLGTPSESIRKANARPGLYQQQSRSLIDLHSVNARNNKQPSRSPSMLPPIHRHRKEEAAPAVAASPDLSAQSPPDGLATPGALRRRRSMYEVGAQPPPYAVIHKRPEGPQMIFPREEEGREMLPNYTCAVHIEGYLPRKMEFSSPGVQAKDRSWRRQYFVLHGTCLKVYKNDLSGENMIGKGTWGEIEGVHVHKEPMNEDGPVAPVTSGSGSGSHSREATGASNKESHHGSSSGSGLNAAVEAVTSLTNSFNINSKGGLIKTYSLQGAESGVAADYLKRRHVVRIRVEGEQFLLQTRNDRHVVDWIEACQAATNVALDLERRPMPKFITLPRRRRRRRRDGAAEPSTAEAAREAADIAEARRRSIATGAGGNRAISSSRLPPPRPLGLPGDETPNPSAAFDEMLREEHDDLLTGEAADI